MIDMNNFFWARAMSRGFLFQFPVPWLLQCCCSFLFAFTSRLYTRALCDPSNEGRVTGSRNGWSLVLGFTLQEQIDLPHGLLLERFIVIGNERFKQGFLRIREALGLVTTLVPLGEQPHEAIAVENFSFMMAGTPSPEGARWNGPVCLVPQCAIALHSHFWMLGPVF